jgi:hypothetical protein
VASQKLSGHLKAKLFMIMMRCCSICLVFFIFQTKVLEKMRYIAINLGDLNLVEQSYLLTTNHSMVIENATQQMKKFMKFLSVIQKKICSQTRKMNISQ